MLDWLGIFLLGSRLMPSQNVKLGLIAGNGKFPLLVLDAARAQGFEVVVVAIKEEASPEIEDRGGLRFTGFLWESFRS